MLNVNDAFDYIQYMKRRDPCKTTSELSSIGETRITVMHLYLPLFESKSFVLIFLLNVRFGMIIAMVMEIVMLN